MEAHDATQRVEHLVEVSFPGWPSPLSVARAVAPAAPREWATQRQAGEATAIVVAAVGVPAVVAVGGVLTTFVLTSAVLAAPVVAVALAWAAWHFNRRPAPPARASPGAPAS